MPDPVPSPGTDGPPLGGWPRVYALVCVLAVVVMLLLWWFTAHFNLRMEAA
ncbi:MAG: hypothetical protein JNM25_12420 [Planctomycetes bacterium]|nr:hypothetical protein [Planctomycetota bacterium]